VIASGYRVKFTQPTVIGLLGNKTLGDSLGEYSKAGSSPNNRPFRVFLMEKTLR
jgi:hypothetical protein